MSTGLIRVFVPGPSSRFYPDLRDSFATNGIDITVDARKLSKRVGNIEFIFARGFDIPNFVKYGWGHAGITGIDAIVEAGYGVDVLSHLGVRHSTVVFASSQINGVNELTAGDIIVSEYKEIGPLYLRNRNITGIDFRFVTGGVESIAHFNNVKGIFTLKTSGQSLHDNNIKLLDNVLDTHACFVGNKNISRYESQVLNDLMIKLPSYDFKDERQEFGSFSAKSLNSSNRLFNFSD